MARHNCSSGAALAQQHSHKTVAPLRRSLCCAGAAQSNIRYALGRDSMVGSIDSMCPIEQEINAGLNKLRV